MPLKDAASYVRECLQSIRDQDFKDWELLIINDHSSDRSEAIVKEYCFKDSRIKLFTNKGQGIVEALKTGFNQASGTMISRMDADDIMPPHRLSRMYKNLVATPPKTVVTGKVRYFPEQDISLGYQQYERWLNERIDAQDHWDWVYRECVIASPNWMVRRQDLVDLDGFENCDYPEDYDLVLKWYRGGFDVQSVEDITLHWREHPSRTSRTSVHYDQAHFFRLKVKHFLEEELNETTPLVLCGTNEKGKLIARLLIEAQCDFQWLSIHPEKHRAGIYNHKVHAFELSVLAPNSKLIIAFYPSPPDQPALATHLYQFNLKMGQDYWYF